MERRRFLAASAAVTAIGLAGCGEPDDEDGDDDDGGGYTLSATREESPERSAETR
ncbi:hypothetical protein [Natronococcus pandeyae]|uniref:hypothetical protein n=1 Tax=Natronococcus pandeyae TaxID=2055836 RepID=UPI0016530E5A|nr:hypothetical protein [Natronococcus pandeyae]